MPASAILGAQWGDEGKGKLVDLFAEQAHLVVRFQGGPNAGHTIYVDGDEGPRKLVLHHLPSGLVHPEPRALMAAGMVVDPTTLLTELDRLRNVGVQVTPKRLRISLDAHVILPIHRAIDAAREARRGGKIGTTLRGVGPAYEDRAARRGLRFRDLYYDDRVAERVEAILLERNAALSAYGAEPLDLAGEIAAIAAWRDAVLPFCGETSALIDVALDEGQRVLFEGAQGALLDLALGTYPYVTSSHTTTAGIFVGAGLPTNRLDTCLGVTKAYATRVGEGPFPTELTDDVGLSLAQRGHEFGSTTGRPRRCGWLDLVALRHAARICGCTSLAITKLDVLSGFERIGLCVAYETPLGPGDRFPNDVDGLTNCRPIWEWRDGWQEPLGDLTAPDQLPETCAALLDRIERAVGLPIRVVSVGPGRHQSMVIGDPLWETTYTTSVFDGTQ